MAEAELVYQPTREWQRPASAPSQTNTELAENDYTPKRGASIALKFSSGASALDMTPTAGGSTVHGTRNAQPTERAFYELELFAGGRFVVQVEGGGLVAEHTVYGSGVPIVSSTRGVVTPAP